MSECSDEKFKDTFPQLMFSIAVSRKKKNTLSPNSKDFTNCGSVNRTGKSKHGAWK